MALFFRPLFTSLLLLTACSTGSEIPSDDGNPDAQGPGMWMPEEASLAIVAPGQGSMHVRDYVGRLGALTALIELQIRIEGPVARVAVETEDGEALGTVGADMVLRAELVREGAVTLLARAYDQAGNQLATDSLAIEIAPPEAADCYDWLALYGVEYTRGPINQGVQNPVTVTTPINGMEYRYISRVGTRQTFFMDCNLALSLARASYELRKRDVIEVVDIGVYNYRCIGSGTPPDCNMSQHAYARGIDIAGLTTGDGSYHSVKHDWVIDTEGLPTCGSPVDAGADRFLHETICALKAARVWNIVLTPNYNAAHRDHFHVDLTTGADYMKLHGDDEPDFKIPEEPDQGPDNH